MTFELYTRKRIVTDKPKVSILKQGIIGLNQSCYSKYFKSYNYVYLLFDKENRKIGLKPTNEEDNNTLKIRVSRDGRLAQISASAFLNYFDIQHDESQPYDCEWDQNNQLLVVQL